MKTSEKGYLSQRKELLTAVQKGVQPIDFEDVALALFRFQYRFNPIYQKYVNLLNVRPEEVEKLPQIPFLPIEMFKNHTVITGPPVESSTVFRSSRTTGQKPSQHFVPSLEHYHHMCQQCLYHSLGASARDYYWLALLPSYLERRDASLVYMAKHFAALGKPLSRHFYLDDYEELHWQLRNLMQAGQPVILLGVTFALLDFAAAYPGKYEQLFVIETGGMKGRGRELIRPELHRTLHSTFREAEISSEYGMTELLSQAYWQGGRFSSPLSMRVFPRDMNDPLRTGDWHSHAAFNIVDLANIDSCAFIATDDMGKVEKGGRRFEVLGRLDEAELRGCNLMYTG